MPLFRRLRNWLIEFKILTGRTAGYLSLFNTGMIMFLFLGDLKERGYIAFDIGSYALPIYLGTMLIFVAIGAFEVYYLKGAGQEARRASELNPEWVDMKNKIDVLYEERNLWA